MTATAFCTIQAAKSRKDLPLISKRELIEGIRSGLKDVKAGKGVSLEQFMQEMNEQ